MIAKFSVLLPYYICVPGNAVLKPYEYDHAGTMVRVYPPQQSNVDPSVSEVTSPDPIIDAFRNLDARRVPVATPAIVIDGHPALRMNLLQVDLLRESFDRSRGRGEHIDPPPSLLFDIVNSVVGRLRTTLQSGRLRYLTPENVLGWRIEYLDDDGCQLPVDAERVRATFSAKTIFETTALNSDVWRMAQELPSGYAPPVWENLLLDAGSALPEVGPSIVLANAALETFINVTLDQLSRSSTPSPKSWKRLSRRDDPRKQPSAREQYHQVLRLLTGRSLTEDPDLWRAHLRLREARNSLVHEGKAMTGSKKGDRIEVTPGIANEMVGDAKRIILWVEELLPEEQRRKFYHNKIMVRMNKAFTGDNSEGAYLVGYATSGHDVKII